MNSKRYPEEFKREAVRQVTDRGHSVAQVASRLGVTTHSLYAWLRKYGPQSSEHQAKANDQAEAKARLDIETCFAAGTLVHTKEGLRPIEELQVGDLVLTWPEDKPIPVRPCYPFRLEEEYIYKPVTRTFVHEDQMVSHVLIRGTGHGDDETLRVTPNHPFWSKRGGWVPTSVLKFGHTLKCADFSDNLLRRATHDVERVRVYNIEVEECHTYFVGKMGVWVHNKGEAVVGISSIRDVQVETLIYGELDHYTGLDANTNRLSGFYTEQLALDAMEARIIGVR